MKKILVTFSNFDRNCPETVELLRGNGFTFEFSGHDRPYYNFEELCRSLPDTDAVIAGLDRFDEAVFARAPRLRVLARCGVGVDGIDMEAARRHGVKVVNTRGSNALAVAEQALGLMLAACRRIPSLSDELHGGRWVRCAGREITGKTVGLIGFGDTAMRLAELLTGFRVRLLACRRHGGATPESEKLGVEMTDLDTLLHESDFISLHIPGTAENAGFLSAARLAEMKPGAVLVNTARGSVLDGAAVLKAVRAGRLFGAGIDVYAPEPPLPGDPLLQDERIVCTPHSASETAESYRRSGEMLAREILDVFAGRIPDNWLNP